MLQAVMAKTSFPAPDRQWRDDASGRTVVGFTVFADGTMGDLHIINSCGYDDLDEAALAAVRDGHTERWTPGTDAGRPVTVAYALPIQYKQM